MTAGMTTFAIDKQTYTYKTVDGNALLADVYVSQPPAPRPVVIWIHGGCLMYGDRDQLMPYQMEKYLQAGFTVVSIDYRLAPETKLPLIIEDLQDLYAWVLAQGPSLFWLDGERVAVVGHSAGGYLTLMAGFCVEPRPKTLVSFYGYGDITGEWYSRPDPFYCQQPLVSAEEAQRNRGLFYLYCRQTGRWPLEVGDHDPAIEPQWFIPYSPVQNVTGEYPPTLLVHGVPDTDVPYEQSVLMAEQFALHEVVYKFITLADLGHAFDFMKGAENDPQVQVVFDQVIEFLHEYV
jgi:acetyl esterase/lipase